MANIIEGIPGFAGGVSQQSPTLRLKTQVERMENCHVTLSDGCMKRPNADFIADLGTLPSTAGYFMHRISRDVNEKYNVIVKQDTNNPIEVYDLDGNRQTVRYGELDADLNYTPNAGVKQYINATLSNAKKEIKAVSIADYTLILNTNVTAARKSSQTAARPDLAYVHCKARHAGDSTITLHWKISDVPGSCSYTVTTGSSDYKTNAMASAFATNLQTAAGANATITATGSVVKIEAGVPIDAGTLRVTCNDPAGDNDLIPINFCEVESMDKLPPTLDDDLIVKIHGDTDIEQDDYFMKFNAETKTWVEHIGWEEYYELDEGTLPHRLVRTAAGEFTFAPCLWEEKVVGDSESNPMPSIIGREIQYIYFHKNRLWLLAKDSYVGSKAGDYFNYFASTVMDILDDDPIDVSMAGEQVNIARAVKGFDKGLVAFGEEEQAILTSGDQLLTPKSAAFEPTTAFTVHDTGDPCKLGPDVYFVSPKQKYMAIRQYTIMPDTLLQDAPDVTAHCPRYIPKGDVILTGCNQMDVMAVHTSADPNAIYIHKFLWMGNEKAQTAWYRWSFAEEIIAMQVVNTAIYVLFDAGSTYQLQKIELENVPQDNLDFRYFLDKLHSVTGGSYLSPNTTFTLPVDVGDGSDWVVVDASTNLNVSTDLVSLSGTSLVISGDVSANTYYVGRKYTSLLQLSEWYARDNDGKALIAGQLTVRSLLLAFNDTGYFKVNVTPFLGSTATEEITDTMSGLRIGETIIGQASLLSGEHEFLVGADSKRTVVEIESDSYLPMNLQIGAWIGEFVMDGKVVG